MAPARRSHRNPPPSAPGGWLGWLGYELKTPLAAILAQTQAALGRRRTARVYRQTLEACERHARRLSRIATRLLNGAGTDVESETPHRREVGLRACLEECVAWRGLEAEEAGVALRLHEGPEVTADTDPDFLAIVLDRQLAVVLRAAGHGGEIALAGREAEEGRAEIEIAARVGVEIAGGVELKFEAEPAFATDYAVALGYATRVETRDDGARVLTIALRGKVAKGRRS